MNKRQFREHITPILEKWGIKLSLENKTKLPENTGGFFDSEGMELAVAWKAADSFALLVHEFCHASQWRTKNVFWEKYSIGHTNFFNWLESKRPVSKEVVRWRNDAIAIEHDCEVKALKLIKDLKLEIDSKVYAQKANAYLAGYLLICTYHKWPRKGDLYADKVSQMFPVKLLSLSKIKDENYLKDNILEEMTKLYV